MDDREDETNCEFVCSRGILKSCDIYSYKPVSSIRNMTYYDYSDLYDCSADAQADANYKTLYVCISALPDFIQTVFPRVKNSFILVTGDSDETCPNDILEHQSFIEFIESDKVIHWFAQNCIQKAHPKLTQIPIGLDYHTMASKDHEWGAKSTPIEQERELKRIRETMRPTGERMLKCYSNFHFFMTTKFGYDRQDAINKIPRDLVYYEPTKLKRSQTWAKQTEFAFVISPHGNGLDCHRTWEALCLGCIPIVKTSCLDPLFFNFPVLIVQNWSDINAALLKNTVDRLNVRFSYKDNECLTLKYWMNKINSYKQIRSYVDTSRSSLYTPSASKEKMKTYSVIICGCCRNNAQHIAKTMAIMNAIGAQFRDYRIVIYENDSMDNTRQILRENANSKTDLILEDGVNIARRTERIAHCRNKILDYIFTEYDVGEYEYMLMLDMDDIISSGELVHTLHTCFLYKQDQWDAMFANCSDKYYDIYALRKNKYLTVCCWNVANNFMKSGMSYDTAYNECIERFLVNYPTGGELIPVLSAFGGAGLYKRSSIMDARYIGVEPAHLDTLICEHVPFHKAMVDRGCKLYINPKLLIR